MLIQLKKIANTRSGDKGPNTNIGIIFKNKEIYVWAKKNISSAIVHNHFKNIVKGEIIRYELDNIYALNFILHDSLGGGGSDSLVNDAQGKTHAQTLLMMDINLPDNLGRYVNE